MDLSVADHHFVIILQFLHKSTNRVSNEERLKQIKSETLVL